jgi:hypothetical protein
MKEIAAITTLRGRKPKLLQTKKSSGALKAVFAIYFRNIFMYLWNQSTTIMASETTVKYHQPEPNSMNDYVLSFILSFGTKAFLFSKHFLSQI